MNKLNKEDLLNLASPREGWCVSIYMPTIEKSKEVRQNSIRFKNLVNQVEEDLKAGGLDNNEASQYIAQLHTLIKNNGFWQQQDQGLAVFLSQDYFETYSLAYEVDDLALIGDRFYLKPMLPMLQIGDEFYILALSQNEVRFLKATENSVEEVEVPELPENMEEALQLDEDEDHIQWHTGTSQPRGATNMGGERAGMYHGHGGEDADKDADLRQYFGKIDSALTNFLKDNKAPLVLAGVDYLLPIYKEANNYQHLADEIVQGNPKLKKNEDLRDEAWKLIKPVFQTTKERTAERYRMLAGRNDQLAVKDVEEILKAAPYGRVEVLFVDKNAMHWGAFDEQNITVQFDEEKQPGSQELLDLAAVHTLQNGGSVYALDSDEMPEPGIPAAAILRY